MRSSKVSFMLSLPVAPKREALFHALTMVNER
jgi:hypothetical protein